MSVIKPYESKYSPCAYQTPEEIETYYRNVEVGGVAVVRKTQHHLLCYSVRKVEGLNPKLGRIYVEQDGAFYIKSGKNCFHPKGQTSLVVPTPDVLEWAEAHPRGELNVSIYPPEKRRI
ncbi:hypothetical protein GF108_01210 [Phyllobacterium sp. SYP-B3895]|uniref:hypothetical protein n=1 Tax=Phyllobacterium sp. SYP-B3895 TaxID=2663240 RepID=UPI001299C2C4|nr:hypothetical protein [Phyllobacterium sp. SYP-B3895]MRG54201.1 hypothetical protein [Phyllobacterium sp. SYP-B3895]